MVKRKAATKNSFQCHGWAIRHAVKTYMQNRKPFQTCRENATEFALRSHQGELILEPLICQRKTAEFC